MAQRSKTFPVAVLLSILLAATSCGKKQAEFTELTFDREYKNDGLGFQVADVRPTTGDVASIQFEGEAKPRKIDTYQVKASITNHGTDSIVIEGADLMTFDPFGLSVRSVDSAFEGGPVTLSPGQSQEFTRRVNSTVEGQVQFNLIIDQSGGQRISMGPFRIMLGSR